MPPIVHIATALPDRLATAGCSMMEAWGVMLHQATRNGLLLRAGGVAAMILWLIPAIPKKSILIHRMKSLDPGVAMPELGRSTVHQEGTELLEKWISFDE